MLQPGLELPGQSGGGHCPPMLVHTDNEVLGSDFFQDGLPFSDDFVRIILTSTILDNDFPESEPLPKPFAVMFGCRTPMGLFEFAHPDKFHVKHRIW